MAGKIESEDALLSHGTYLLLRWVLRDYLRPHWRTLLAASGCMAVTALAAATMAWLAKPILDEAFASNSAATLYTLSIAVFAVMVVNGLSIYGHTVLMQSMTQRIDADVQVKIFERTLNADLADIDRNHTGQLVARCLADGGTVSAVVSDISLGLARDLLMFLGLAAVMVYRDWQSALVIVLVLPVVGLTIGRIGRKARQTSASILDQMGQVTKVISQAFAGTRLIKSYGSEVVETQRAREAIEKRRKLTMRLSRAQAMTSPVTETLGGAAIALTIFYGTWRAEQGDFTVGTFASFLAALALSYRPLKRLTQLNVMLQGHLAGASRVRTIFDYRPHLRDRTGARRLVVKRGAIRFDKVRYAYGDGDEVLMGIDLSIESGKVVALVGESGAGKSTLVNLIPRLYDVTGGCITIDGTDIRDVTLGSLRQSIALVGQETILFDDTIGANIAYGRPSATQAEIVEAARTAGAEEFIDGLPYGYDTVIGELGVILSGGQRQRIAIARAVLKDAPIVLLDEATSALDNQTERQVRSGLARLMEGRTTLVVAHRLSSIIDADEIYVLSEGRITESGRHGELLSHDGDYARLYLARSTEEEGTEDTRKGKVFTSQQPRPSPR